VKSRRQRAIEDLEVELAWHRTALECWIEVRNVQREAAEIDLLIEVTGRLAQALLMTDAEFERAYPLPIWRRVTERLQEALR
jgi:hypothetical protein